MLTSRIGILQKKPYSAVTVQIDRLTSEQYDADDMSGIPDLIEVVRLQIEGPTEAARAIRKKLYETLDEFRLTVLTRLGNTAMCTGNCVR